MKDWIQVSCVSLLDSGILGLSEFWLRFWVAEDELTIPMCSTELQSAGHFGFGTSSEGKTKQFLLL